MIVSTGENAIGRTSNRMSMPRIRKAPRPNMRPRLKSPLPRIGSIASRSIIESFTHLASVRATWGLDRNRSNRTRALCGATARWALCHHVSQKCDTPIAYEGQPCGASRGPFLRMLASVIGGPHSCSAITCQFRASHEQQAQRSYRAERQHRQNDAFDGERDVGRIFQQADGSW
jgi:hypothetical protein